MKYTKPPDHGTPVSTHVVPTKVTTGPFSQS
jgi:hypothetical protein